MDTVNCKIEIPEVKGLEANEMTVGRHLLMNCEGNWDKSFDFTKATVKLEDTNKYILKVLKAEARTVSSFDLDLTTYVAGNAQIPEMILTDGVHEISLGSQKFQTKSVLKPPQQGQTQEPQKPFGYIFPLRLEWPTVYFVMAAAALVLFLVALIFQLRRAARFAKLIADLKEYNSSIEPDLQFYKSLRILEKQDYPIDELEKSFRLYVLRAFGVPMFVLNQRQIINFMKKRKPQFKTERQQIDKLLSEFDEINNKKAEKISAEAKQELIHKLYRFVDRTQSLKAAL